MALPDLVVLIFEDEQYSKTSQRLPLINTENTQSAKDKSTHGLLEKTECQDSKLENQEIKIRSSRGDALESATYQL